MSETGTPPSSHPISALEAWRNAVRSHAASTETRPAESDRHRRRCLLPYPGAKSKVLKKLLAATPPHSTSVEVFGGSAVYTFAKPCSKQEVVNDLDGEMFNFFQVVKNHPDELAAMMAADPRSRRRFDELVAQNPAALDPVNRAARTLYIGAHGFCCGQRHKPYFAILKNAPQRMGVQDIVNAIYEWSARFQDVTLENLDFGSVISKYDAERTFFFIDSPYPGLEGYYRTTFSKADHARLAQTLSRIRGSALVTLPDQPAVRSLYGWASGINTLSINYTLSGTHQKTDELLIYINYHP